MIRDVWLSELYIEDGRVVVKTDSAREIFLCTDRRYCCYEKAKEASLELGECNYFRITVLGEDGRASWTRAYFTDTL